MSDPTQNERDAGLDTTPEATRKQRILAELQTMSATELRRHLAHYILRPAVGLQWERDFIDQDQNLEPALVVADVIATEQGQPVSYDFDAHFNVSNPAPFHHMVVEGDNIDALRLLRTTHQGKIRVIYIDPPYNTGNKDWVYNDAYFEAGNQYKHSTWLEFMYQRMLLARELLTADGVILISINDENRAKLELLMDQVMPNGRIGSFVWRSRTGGNDTKGAFLSTNHEHVLIYGRSGFKFNGSEKNYSMYKYQDDRGIYRLDNLTKAHDLNERPNTYYPIYNPKTDIWYPCNPDSVWRFSSRHKIKDGQKTRAATLEDQIEQGLIWFPIEANFIKFDSKDELIAAIKEGKIPHSNKKPLIRLDLPDLDFWVGRKIGFGRPAFKRYKESLVNESQPISSWITPKFEADTILDNTNMPICGTTEEGSNLLREMMGNKAFSYPKPLSLLQSILEQATAPNDIILDFFAGSGTTAHAVLAINADHQDEAPRRFIMVSSTERTAQEPHKNLCRDVTAQRITKVLDQINDDQQKQRFAYLRLQRIDVADALYDLSPERAWHILNWRERQTIRPYIADQLYLTLAEKDDQAILFCAEVSDATLQAIINHPAQKITVYSDRCQTVQHACWSYKTAFDSLSWLDEIVKGQQK